VGTLGVESGVAEAQAGECDDLVAQGADPVFGLPGPAPGDAGPGVQGVMPGVADQRSGPGVREGLERPRTAEERAPLRSARAELRFRGKGQVHFELVGQQEHADGLRPGRQVPMVDGAEVVVEVLGPTLADPCRRAAHREDQIDVRPLVAGADRL
jgi:hypothetical protein